MTRMTGSDCAVMCNLINTHTHTHAPASDPRFFVVSIIDPPLGDQCEWHRLVAANPDNLENGKEAGGRAQGTQSLSKNCTSRESVSPFLRLIRRFRSKYHWSSLGRINASGIE